MLVMLVASNVPLMMVVMVLLLLLLVLVHHRGLLGLGRVGDDGVNQLLVLPPADVDFRLQRSGARNGGAARRRLLRLLRLLLQHGLLSRG